VSPSGPPPRKSRALPVIVGIVIATAIGVGVAQLGKPQEPVSPPKPTFGTSTPAKAPKTLQAVVPAPTAADYALTIKTLTEECFGSAGCLTDIRVSVASRNPARTRGKAVEITYKLNGASDGAQIDTIVLGADGDYAKPQLSLETAKQGAKLTATITAVEVTR
jgi:hypothetical protein